MSTFLKEQLDSFCVACYGMPWEQLPVDQRLQLEDVFMAGDVSVMAALQDPRSGVGPYQLHEELQRFQQQIEGRYERAMAEETKRRMN